MHATASRFACWACCARRADCIVYLTVYLSLLVQQRPFLFLHNNLWPWPGPCGSLLPVKRRISRAAGDLPLWPLQFPLPVLGTRLVQERAKCVLSLCLGLACRPRAWPALFSRLWNCLDPPPVSATTHPGVPFSLQSVFSPVFYFSFFDSFARDVTRTDS